MNPKYLAEIKAREQAATKGPWFYSLNGYIIPNDGGEPVAFVGGSGDQAILDCKFISRARTDIPALIAEVERLTKENQGLRANSMIQEHIILGGYDPADKDKIVRLIMDNAAKDQQIATLKKQLEIPEYGYVDCMAAERQADGKCLGYARSGEDDEPCEQCRECPVNTSYEAQEQEEKK